MSADQIVALVHCQPEGEAALRARVPVATERACEQLERLTLRLVAELGGELLPANLTGVLVRFGDVRAAVAFALRLQLELLEVSWAPTLILRPEAAELRDGDRVLFRGLRVRTAVHRGEPYLQPDGSWDGPAVQQVARLCAGAAGGQIVLDDSAWRVMRGNPGVPFVLRDLGAHRLAGVSGRGRVIQLLPRKLDARPLPPYAGLDEVRTNLAPPRAPWLGRDGDVAALAELETFGVRCVTISGPPGIGASRLAQQHAWLHRERYVGGAWWVALPTCTGERPIRLPTDDLLAEVAHALGLSLSHARTDEDAAAQIGWSLAGRGRCLLVLDALGGDHEVTRVVAGWLRAAPQLRVLALAPRRLGLPGELVYELGPMHAGESLDATRLLLHRALLLGVTLDEAPARQLAQRVGGLAASLSLAAGAIPRMASEDLAERLDGRPERMAEIAWELCTPAEREVLRCAAIFPAAFSPAHLLPVVDPALAHPSEILAAIADLAVRGWLHHRCLADQPARELFVVGRLARRWLAQAPDLDRPGRELRFAVATVAAGEQALRAAYGPESTETVARLAAERPALFAVVEWGLADPRAGDRVDLAIRALLVLQPLFEMRGPFTTHLRLLDAAKRVLDTALGSDTLLQVRLLFARAEALWIRGRGRAGVADLERGTEIAARWDDHEGLALSRLGLAIVAGERGEDTADALVAVAESLGSLGRTREESLALAAAGRGHFAFGRLPAAEAALRRAVELARSIGAHRDEARFLVDLARVLWRVGRLELARGSFRESFRLHQEAGDRRREAHAASSLGDLDHDEGRLSDAAANMRHAAAVAREVGERRIEAHALGVLGLVDIELGHLEVSRRSLLQSLAIYRDLRDLRGEGVLVGRLGLMHHLGGHRTAAADYYRRSVAALTGERRELTTWTAWLAALEAEEGELAEARIAADAAFSLAQELDDPALSSVVAVLGGAIDLREAALCADPSDALRWQDPVRERIAVLRARRGALPAELRLPVLWIEGILARGFPT